MSRAAQAVWPIPTTVGVHPKRTPPVAPLRGRPLLNAFVFIIDIDLPVAIMRLWTFLCKHSAGGSFTDKLSHMNGSVENTHRADQLGTSALGVQVRLEGGEREWSLRARQGQGW